MEVRELTIEEIKALLERKNTEIALLTKNLASTRGKLATAVEALTRIKFNGLFKKAGPHGDYAPYNVATQTEIAEKALAEIGGEDEI